MQGGETGSDSRRSTCGRVHERVKVEIGQSGDACAVPPAAARMPPRYLCARCARGVGCRPIVAVPLVLGAAAVALGFMGAAPGAPRVGHRNALGARMGPGTGRRDHRACVVPAGAGHRPSTGNGTVRSIVEQCGAISGGAGTRPGPAASTSGGVGPG
jgi:hypothetical protein